MARTIHLTDKEADALGYGRMGAHDLIMTDQEAEGLLRLTQRMIETHTDTQDQASQAVWQSLRERLTDAPHTPDPPP
jgi:hypothetical protein